MRTFVICLLLIAIGPGAALAQAQEPGYVEGRLIEEATGEPIPDLASVTAVDASGSPVATSAPSDESGSYRLGPMPAGVYRLVFADSRLFRYAGEWWSDKTSLETADLVVVERGATVTGVDFRLAPPPVPAGGYVTGRLVLDDGTPVPEGFRLAINAYADDGTVVGGAVGWTDAAGSYRVGPFAAGRHRLLLIDNSWFALEGVGCPCVGPDGAELLFTSWWPSDRRDFASAASIEIAIDGSVTADFTLRAIGAIPGTTTTGPPSLPYTGTPAVTIVLTALGLTAMGVGAVTTSLRSRRRT